MLGTLQIPSLPAAFQLAFGSSMSPGQLCEMQVTWDWGEMAGCRQDLGQLAQQGWLFQVYRRQMPAGWVQHLHTTGDTRPGPPSTPHCASALGVPLPAAEPPPFTVTSFQVALPSGGLGGGQLPQEGVCLF